MAELSTVARPYAEALFQAAGDDGAMGLAGWADLVGEMAQVAANPDVRNAMSDPRLDDAQRIRVFSSLLGATARVGRQLDRVAGSERPPAAAAEIAELFIALKNRHEGTAQAEITSAFELSEAQVKDLVVAPGRQVRPQAQAPRHGRSLR